MEEAKYEFQGAVIPLSQILRAIERQISTLANRDDKFLHWQDQHDWMHHRNVEARLTTLEAAAQMAHAHVSGVTTVAETAPPEESKGSSASSAPTTGRVGKPSESSLANQDWTPTPSVQTETTSESRRLIESIVFECERWLRDTPYRFVKDMRPSFSSFLRSTLQSHMTSGAIKAGDPGLVGHDC